MQLSPRYDGPPVLALDGPPDAAHEPTVRQRRRLESVLGGLSPEDWARPSRCEGWTVQDVISHLATVNGFWAVSVRAGVNGEPTRYLAAFDPVATPEMLVDATRAQSPQAVLDSFVASNDDFLGALDELDAEGWIALAEAPPGHVPIARLAEHALWDGWVHERDIMLPLGLEPEVEADEVRVSLRYGAALSPAFAITAGSSRPAVLAVETTDLVPAFVLDVDTEVSVRDGSPPTGVPVLRGEGVALTEAISLRMPFPDSTPTEWLALMAGLSTAFDAPPLGPTGG